MPKNDKNEQITNKLNFTQREMINQFDYMPFKDGMCAGVVFAFAGLFFQASNPKKFYSNFFSKNSLHPFKEFAKNCIFQQEEFAKQHGDVKGFVEDNFQENIKSIETTNTIDNTFRHVDAEIQKGRTAIFVLAFLESRKNPSVIPFTSHLIALFHINDLYFFVEPNHGLLGFNSFDEFASWFHEATAKNGILAYLPNNIGQNTNDINFQYQGLAKNFKGMQNVIYSFELPVKMNTKNNPLISWCYPINTHDNQGFNRKLISRL